MYSACKHSALRNTTVLVLVKWKQQPNHIYHETPVQQGRQVHVVCNFAQLSNNGSHPAVPASLLANSINGRGTEWSVCSRAQGNDLQSRHNQTRHNGPRTQVVWPGQYQQNRSVNGMVLERHIAKSGKSICRVVGYQWGNTAPLDRFGINVCGGLDRSPKYFRQHPKGHRVMYTFGRKDQVPEGWALKKILRRVGRLDLRVRSI